MYRRFSAIGIVQNIEIPNEPLECRSIGIVGIARVSVGFFGGQLESVGITGFCNWSCYYLFKNPVLPIEFFSWVFLGRQMSWNNWNCEAFNWILLGVSWNQLELHGFLIGIVITN